MAAYRITSGELPPPPPDDFRTQLSAAALARLGRPSTHTSENIKTRRPSWKLDHKNHGPFQVEKIVSPLAVRLTLPRKWKIHNVFHVSLLEPYRTSEHQAPLDPSKLLREADDIEQSEEYNVDEVVGSTRKGCRLLYLVKWLDYPGSTGQKNHTITFQ